LISCAGSEEGSRSQGWGEAMAISVAKVVVKATVMRTTTVQVEGKAIVESIFKLKNPRKQHSSLLFTFTTKILFEGFTSKLHPQPHKLKEDKCNDFHFFFFPFLSAGQKLRPEILLNG